MKNFYLYTDSKSLQTLTSPEPKIINIGSDFGYGNFGDVMQHIGANKCAKSSGRFSSISVMGANAISQQDFPSWVREAYGSDGVIFVSEYPLLLSNTDPDLYSVSEICNIAGIHLYGGGFLNTIWGDYVLSVVEHFLHANPFANYWVSGQQITAPYEERVAQHIREFKPSLFAVRDEQSLQLLKTIGIEADYSFDDATEGLLALRERIPVRHGDGLFLHLNSSDYTANTSLQMGLCAELAQLAQCDHGQKGVTVFQAFRDTRIDVFDTTETIKQLDYLFPFSDVRLIHLVGLLLDHSGNGVERVLEAGLGYSCSYHVTLWLQLAGIPCWLRSSNPFYDQKSRALQVSQSLEEFLQAPRLADHSLNLERRAAWNDKFQQHLARVERTDNLIRFKEPADGPAPWQFYYKGKPTLQERLTEATDVQNWYRERAHLAEHARSELEERVLALTERLTDLGNQAHHERRRADSAERMVDSHVHAARELQHQIGTLHGQLQAITSQLHHILDSWSWKITRGPRGLARILRGDFSPLRTVVRKILRKRD